MSVSNKSLSRLAKQCAMLLNIRNAELLLFKLPDILVKIQVSKIFVFTFFDFSNLTILSQLFKVFNLFIF
jgi:hypothetical protein